MHSVDKLRNHPDLLIHQEQRARHSGASRNATLVTVWPFRPGHPAGLSVPDLISMWPEQRPTEHPQPVRRLHPDSAFRTRTDKIITHLLGGLCPFHRNPCLSFRAGSCIQKPRDGGLGNVIPAAFTLGLEPRGSSPVHFTIVVFVQSPHIHLTIAKEFNIGFCEIQTIPTSVFKEEGFKDSRFR